MKWMIQWAVTSSALILIVLAVRFFCKDKLSARWRYALWVVVLVRLLVPFQVELPANSSAALPLLASNLAPEIGEKRSVPVFPEDRQPISQFNFAFEDLLEPGEIMPTETSMGYYQRSQDGETIIRYMDLWSPAQIVGAVWGTGAVLMTLVLLASNLRFARRLKKRRRRLEGMEAPIPVYTADGLPSPCLFGVFRPAVYMTPGAAEDPDTLRHVLAHELTHYVHKDHIWSLLRCLALALHWYNPLVWLAMVLSKGDGELACDEGAVARLGEGERIPYGRTLVDMVAQRSRPADLLSCSTAMTGGKKSIQQRVAQLVKRRSTVKAALFAAVALVALAAVFVFAGRKETGPYDAFLAQVEKAQSVFVGNPLISSQMSPPPISDPEKLAQAKDILSKAMPVVKEEDQWRVMSLSSDKLPEPITQEELEKQFIIGGYRLNLCPTAEHDLDTADSYFLISWDSYCLLTQWYPEREEDEHEVVAAFPGTTVDRLRALARGEEAPEETVSLDLDWFQAQVERADSFQLYLPAGSDQSPPVPITDEELVALSRELLFQFNPLPQGIRGPDWYKLQNASQVVLSNGGEEAVYALVAGSDQRTYLYTKEDYDACLALKEGETRKVTPIGRTITYNIVDRSLYSYSTMQEKRTKDPNYFVPMTYAETNQLTLGFFQEHGITRLQGFEGGIKDADFGYSAYTGGNRIQLRYHGDEAHWGYWVLLLDREDYTVLADQPLVVFLASQLGEEQFMYEVMTTSAIAVVLRPEDVVSVTAGGYQPGQAIDLDIPALKEQLVQALYHQFSGEYDEEKHGQYVLDIEMEKRTEFYGSYEVAEEANHLIISAGEEKDTVCLRKETLAVGSTDITFVRSPELYRTIRNLFD